MRKMASAAMAALVAAGALSALGAAEAQPYGYYTGPGGYGYRYDPPRAYDPYGRYVPGRPYYNGYDGYPGDSSIAGAAGAVLGALLGDPGYGSGYGWSGVPHDRYGPDPNGMIGPDGRRIKCKLRRSYDPYYRGQVTRRECWPT
ncbi:hypothetical protein [Phenylobacterium deserti]|uniref:Lectin-like protein BA14k n=1 Tax=Phenylobacterium deserti TaxID=1914756 RepID=A0A328AAB7_9CAUL|nr:hypothetical protein [Phenylobacterium deserti]RAK51499.1 hypothetical protein DJ018_16335 [Phenylobacterium deserti]